MADSLIPRVIYPPGRGPGYTALNCATMIVSLSSLLIIITIQYATPAVADRHCSPASEDYYNARLALLQTSGNAENSLQESQSDLESALHQARMCSCSKLENAIAELVAAAEDESLSVADRNRQILGAKERVDRLVADCHN